MPYNPNKFNNENFPPADVTDLIADKQLNQEAKLLRDGDETVTNYIT